MEEEVDLEQIDKRTADALAIVQNLMAAAEDDARQAEEGQQAEDQQALAQQAASQQLLTHVCVAAQRAWRRLSRPRTGTLFVLACTVFFGLWAAHHSAELGAAGAAMRQWLPSAGVGRVLSVAQHQQLLTGPAAPLATRNEAAKGPNRFWSPPVRVTCRAQTAGEPVWGILQPPLDAACPGPVAGGYEEDQFSVLAGPSLAIGGLGAALLHRFSQLAGPLDGCSDSASPGGNWSASGVCWLDELPAAGPPHKTAMDVLVTAAGWLCKHPIICMMSAGVFLVVPLIIGSPGALFGAGALWTAPDSATLLQPH
ncbi:hypothetical protein ABPG75_003511 [Micractinium tetrahymenae]